MSGKSGHPARQKVILKIGLLYYISIERKDKDSYGIKMFAHISVIIIIADKLLLYT